MKSLISVFLLMVLVGCEKTVMETGSLVVNVSVGPLCPVEPCKKTPNEIKLAYEAYSLVLTEAISGTLLVEKPLSYDGTRGTFGISTLEVGDYKLTIKPDNVFSRKGFPKDIKIESGKTTTVDISIDTGIR